MSSAIVCSDRPAVPGTWRSPPRRDLGFAGVGNLASLAHGVQAPFELDAEVRVGLGAVAGGAVDRTAFYGEGLDVTQALVVEFASTVPVPVREPLVCARTANSMVWSRGRSRFRISIARAIGAPTSQTARTGLVAFALVDFGLSG
ncbi:hypothetical protein [Streptomyces sp. NPDC101149]|uniref:hypothetical protein n=1 Tax=Streptomyces sp. NPDC101149 TaxID=3366113 RepID=UPI003825EE48